MFLDVFFSFSSGYNRISNLSLKKINGVEVENLLHLHTMIHANKTEFIRFDLDENVYVDCFFPFFLLLLNPEEVLVLLFNIVSILTSFVLFDIQYIVRLLLITNKL
jgi:hypothetical protein